MYIGINNISPFKCLYKGYKINSNTLLWVLPDRKRSVCLVISDVGIRAHLI